MKRGLKGFAFLVSGLVLGIIGATVSATAIALSAVAWRRYAVPPRTKELFSKQLRFRRKKA